MCPSILLIVNVGPEGEVFICASEGVVHLSAIVTVGLKYVMVPFNINPDYYA